MIQSKSLFQLFITLDLIYRFHHLIIIVFLHARPVTASSTTLSHSNPPKYNISHSTSQPLSSLLSSQVVPDKSSISGFNHVDGVITFTVLIAFFLISLFKFDLVISHARF
jgi:hypothetical protein